MSVTETVRAPSRYVHAASAGELRRRGTMVVHAGGLTLALFSAGDRVYAVENRCPHMGFPLDRGTVDDGILTCHWHHARFDLETGGTFDPWADDARVFPVEAREGEIWVDVSANGDPVEHQRRRLRDGLERNFPLVVAKPSSRSTPRESGPPSRSAWAWSSGRSIARTGGVVA